MFNLGSSIAYRDAAARFGLTPVSVFLDQLSCTGQESALLECQSRPLGIAECDASGVAGVQCIGKLGQQLTILESWNSVLK